MTTPNPLIPQGSLLERESKGKPHLRIAYIIVGVHLLFLGGLLIQGCKREETPEGQSGTVPPSTTDSGLLPLDSGSLYSTNQVPTDLAATASGGGTPPLPPATNLLVETPASPAPLTVPAPAELAPAAQEYTVAKGDSFYTIGKKFGVSSREIAKANPTVDPNRLQINQKLVIPAPSTATVAGTVAPAGTGETTANIYTVKSGDTLTKIAQTHGTTVNEIRTLNGLLTDRINVNQKLKLPPPKTPTTTAVTATLPVTGNP